MGVGLGIGNWDRDRGLVVTLVVAFGFDFWL